VIPLSNSTEQNKTVTVIGKVFLKNWKITTEFMSVLCSITTPHWYTNLQQRFKMSFIACISIFKFVDGFIVVKPLLCAKNTSIKICI
jgi:hypothetical protein